MTPATLRAKGKRAEGIDQVLLDLEVVMNKLKQANLLFDADAYDEVRKSVRVDNQAGHQISRRGKSDHISRRA